VKPMMNADGRSMERGNWLREMGASRKATHAERMFRKGPAVSNNHYTWSDGCS